jgi:hypothetical protein
MTHLIIGSYRGSRYLGRALKSIHEHVKGVDRITVVDDSGRQEVIDWIISRPDVDRVVDVGGYGYNEAMREVCKAAGDEAFMFWEEDFTAIQDIDLDEMQRPLDARPYLAQIALLRQPWFPNEIQAGGLIEALQARGHRVEEVYGVLEQTATFTCNPALWRAGIASSGWPEGKWSEDMKRDELLADGYRFGFLPGVRVHHDGVRVGHGY